jgi:polysaccharide transporter, PST family
MITKNAGWLLTDKGIRVSLVMFVWGWIARYWGSEQFGILNCAIALMALLSPLEMLGLENIVFRDLVKLKDKKDSTLVQAINMT